MEVWIKTVRFEPPCATFSQNTSRNNKIVPEKIHTPSNGDPPPFLKSINKQTHKISKTDISQYTITPAIYFKIISLDPGIILKWNRLNWFTSGANRRLLLKILLQFTPKLPRGMGVYRTPLPIFGKLFY